MELSSALRFSQNIKNNIVVHKHSNAPIKNILPSHILIEITHHKTTMIWKKLKNSTRYKNNPQNNIQKRVSFSRLEIEFLNIFLSSNSSNPILTRGSKSIENRRYILEGTICDPDLKKKT